jgi:hypothetical protein
VLRALRGFARRPEDDDAYDPATLTMSIHRYRLRLTMNCRPGCGACCVAPSITSAIPGMPEGKAAGTRRAQLTADLRCAVFGRPERPACCSGLQPSPQMCGRSRADALRRLGRLEAATRP